MVNKNKKKERKNSRLIGLIAIIVVIIVLDIIFFVTYFSIKKDGTASKVVDDRNLSVGNDSLKVEINESLIEAKILELVNEERAKKGISRRVLVINNKLYSLAKSHSNKMIEENFFRETLFPKGQNIAQLQINSNLEKCGPIFDEDEIANCVVEKWKNNTIYNENMITSQYFRTGIGVSCNESVCKVTQLFN